ncbi:hypothetical protein SCUP234_11754 [Seiridium cupressi]
MFIAFAVLQSEVSMGNQNLSHRIRSVESPRCSPSFPLEDCLLPRGRFHPFIRACAADQKDLGKFSKILNQLPIPYQPDPQNIPDGLSLGVSRLHRDKIRRAALIKSYMDYLAWAESSVFAATSAHPRFAVIRDFLVCIVSLLYNNSTRDVERIIAQFEDFQDAAIVPFRYESLLVGYPFKVKTMAYPSSTRKTEAGLVHVRIVDQGVPIHILDPDFSELPVTSIEHGPLFLAIEVEQTF